MMLVVLAHPDTVCPKNACTMAQITPIKLTSATTQPNPVIRRIGLT